MFRPSQSKPKPGASSRVPKDHASKDPALDSKEIDLKTYVEKQKEGKFTSVEYSGIIKSIENGKRLHVAWKAFHDAIDSGWDDVTCHTAMIEVLCKFSFKGKAWDTFEKAMDLKKTNADTIKVFVEQCEKKRWFDILEKIKEAIWDMRADADAKPYNGEKPSLTRIAVSPHILFHIEKKFLGHAEALHRLSQPTPFVPESK